MSLALHVHMQLETGKIKIMWCQKPAARTHTHTHTLESEGCGDSCSSRLDFSGKSEGGIYGTEGGFNFLKVLMHLQYTAVCDVMPHSLEKQGTKRGGGDRSPASVIS